MARDPRRQIAHICQRRIQTCWEKQGRQQAPKSKPGKQPEERFFVEVTPAILAVYESLGIRGVRLEIVGSVRAREASEESDLDITAKHPDHTWKTLMPGADIVEELFNNELEV